MTSTIIPRSWQCPNVYVDELLPMLTDPEWRVLSYMTRQIFGWEDGRLYNRAQIGLAAMVDGCGLSVAGARSALAGLQQFGIVVQVEESRGPVAATWSLQVDADLIDVAGLQARREEKRAGNRARTAAAQTVLSDRTQSDLSDRTQSDLSDRTQSDLSDRTQSDLSDRTQSDLSDRTQSDLSDRTQSDLSDRTDLYIDQNQSSKPDLKPEDPDRQTDRDPQSPAGVCLSDTEKQQAEDRRSVRKAFESGAVILDPAADAQIDKWVAAYPLPAILWAVREALAAKRGGKRISRWSAYVSAILENRAAEGWPAEVLEDLRRGGYAMPADVHDPTAGEFPEEAVQVVADDPADDTAQAGGWSPADVQADPGSELDQAWAAALAALEDRVPPVYVAALASCRLVDLNGRATVRAYDDMAAAAVQRMGRQIEAYFGVSGVDLAPAA